MFDLNFQQNCIFAYKYVEFIVWLSEMAYQKFRHAYVCPHTQTKIHVNKIFIRTQYARSLALHAFLVA